MLKGRKKAINKLLICFMMLLILTSFGISVVFGNDGGGSSGLNDQGKGDGPKCSDCSCSYDNAPSYGVRLSLVWWENGERVGSTHSIDVFSSLEATSRIKTFYKTIYIMPGDNSAKYNRMDMLGQIKDYTSNPSLSTTTWNEIPRVTSDSLEWTGSSISFNYSNIADKIDYSLFVDSLYMAMQKEVDEYKKTRDENVLKITRALFRAFGTEYFDYSEEDLKKMHISIEPVVTFIVKGTSNTSSSWSLFYGTITQVAYAFQRKECTGADADGKWTLSTSLVKKFGLILYAPKDCKTASDKKYCVLNGWLPGDDKVGESNSNKRKALVGSGGKYSVGIGFLWLGALAIPADDCETVVDYVNNLYNTDKIAQDEYDEYILQIKEGKFELKNDAENTIYKIEEPQDYEFLIKANYDKFNEGIAACANREKKSLDCEAALEYINSNYIRTTQAYHNAVDQVEAGTFTYELPDGTTISVDKAYSYDMLNKTIYIRNGGIAACEDIANTCEVYYGSGVNIDDCSTGKTYFKDIEEKDAWLTCEIAYSVGNKIYSSDNTGHDAVETTNGGIVGNAEYCEVFCYEEFETTFPTHVYDVKAGQTFTWGTSSGTFGVVNIRKECSNQNYVKYQQGYRFEEWEEDYKNNEEAMIEHFMKNGAYESMISGITSTSSRYNTCNYKCSTCTRKDGTTYRCNCGYRGCPKWRATARSTGTSESYSHGYIGGITGSVSNQYYSVRGYDTSASAKAAAEAGLKSKLQSLAANEESKYSQKKNQEAELIKKIEQCTNNIEYVYKSTVQFTFKEPVNSVYGANSRSFEFNDNLLVEGNYNQNNVDTSKCVKKTIYKYTCSGYASGVTCVPEAKQVWDCTVVTWDIQGTYTYKYPVEQFQWYSLKTDSTLVNENKKGSEDEAFFYSIGFGLPTALSLTDGTYELKVTVYDLGDDASFSGGNPKYERPEDTHFDPLALNVDTNLGSKKGFEYICTYEVDNEIFGYDCQYDNNGKLIYSSPEYCDPTKDDGSDGSLLGIDITYRLVTLLSDGDTLDKAFPGKEGGGRQPGGNWRLDDELLYEILDANVYNDPAMYEIMLDVNAIQTIREDNQNYFAAGKDPYASYYDANNAQKVYCAVNGDEKYCASDFISDLYNGSGLNYKLLGTCLPTGNTLERAEYILENGCDTHYTYPTINWTR